MKPLKCLIVDDEPVARRIIREYIEDVGFLELSAELEHAGNCNSYLTDNPVDLLFLDIHMPGMTGIEFLKSTTHSPIIIMTTAYPEYAVQGYEFDVLDYLVKPISFDRFIRAANKAHRIFELQANIQRDQQHSLFIKCDRKIENIPFTEILFVEATGNFITIHTKNTRFITWMTFKGIAEKLPPERFVRIHRSYIISLSAILRIDFNKAVLLKTVLPISRFYRKQALRTINQYILKHH